MARSPFCCEVPSSVEHRCIRREHLGVLPGVLQLHPYLRHTLCPSPVCVCGESPIQVISTYSSCLLPDFRLGLGNRRPSRKPLWSGVFLAASSLWPTVLQCSCAQCSVAAVVLQCRRTGKPETGRSLGLSGQLSLAGLDHLACSKPVSK